MSIQRNIILLINT